MLVTVLGLTGALVYVISREQVRVFVVRVDELGNVSTHELTAHSPLAPDVLELVLGKWVRDIRTVTADHEANVARMTEAYAMSSSTVQSQIAEYYHDNPPEELLKKGARFPERVRVSPAGGRTWNLKWEEKIKSEGRVVGVESWEAVLEVEVVTPRNAEERRRSQLGVWVITLHWAPAA